MLYPPPPWTLKGLALLTTQLIDIDAVRPWVPAEATIVQVLPGRTLGSLYFSIYRAGSSLEYSELIVAPALLAYGGKVGAWVSHIYVDSEASVAGGREIWGLPKEMAQFDWSGLSVRVSQPQGELCSLTATPTWLQLPAAVQPQVPGLVFTRLAGQLTWFTARLQGQSAIAQAHLSVGSSSPFYALGLGQPLLTLSLNNLTLQVQAPAGRN